MEWLTTGQMIDRLKVGEVAIGDVKDLGCEVEVHKTKEGHIRFTETKRCMDLTGGFVDRVKWRIIPKYVSFEEAMKALKEGKIVKCETKVNKVTFKPYMDYFTITNSQVYGKWTIEGDTDE